MGIKKIPISKRKELIKEFETLTKQEIALHQKKIQEFQKEINNISAIVREKNKEIFEEYKKLHEYCTEMQKHFDEKNNIDDDFKRLSENIKNAESKCETIINDQNYIKQQLKKYITLQEIKNYKTALETKYNNCLKELSDIKKNNLSILHTIYIKEKENISNRQKDNKRNEDMFLDLKNELNLQKKNVEESCINSEWAKENMRKKDKCLFILERKFEYLEKMLKQILEKDK